MIDKHMFAARVGRYPENDDLERVNCPKAGKLGHVQCGWCSHKNLPRFMCGCVVCTMKNRGPKEVT